VLVMALVAIGAAPVASKEFKFDEPTNERMARKFSLPAFFALPASARASIEADIDTTDLLVDFKHPAAAGDIGLRLVVSKRAGMAARLGKSGLVQTGDILLSFRPEWGGAGAYSNIQMGISHTGLAYLEGGTVRHLDTPLTEEYLGAGLSGDFSSEHYRTLQAFHIIRPRGLSDSSRANISAWVHRIKAIAGSTYPSRIKFNPDYNAPKYKSGMPNQFVKTLGQVALGYKPKGTLAMFCSEFVWSVLSLRNCDPVAGAAAFRRDSMPSCVHEPMRPMMATGDFVVLHTPTSYAGLADGPLMVIDALKLPEPEHGRLLQSVFAQNANNLKKLSPGHRAVAMEMQPKFAQLALYYLNIGGSEAERAMALELGQEFARAVPANYSPASFLINTLLPRDNVNRTMDYVATVVIE
jgi:hypothetical protein